MANFQQQEWQKLQHEFFLKKTQEFEAQVLEEHPDAKLIFPHEEYEWHRRLFDGDVMIYDAFCNDDPEIEFSFFSKDKINHWRLFSKPA